jgi:DNA-binding response OmpR family regulator
LRLAGFNVLSAVTGAEAIKKVSDLSPHLVLLDLMMPEMDGFEIFGYVRQISNIPIIMVSALNSKEDVVRGLENGADDYIPKPFHNAEMIERVKTVLRRSGMPQEISRLVFPAVDLVVD